MTPKVEIPEGYELLSGRGRDNAVKALALAKERGLDESVVLTSTALGGFLIPIGDSVVEGADADESGSEEADEIVSESADGEPVNLEAVTIPELPDPEKATVADIDAFGAEHFPGLALEGTKAEKVEQMQAALEAAPALTDESGEPAGDDVPKED